MAIKDVLNCYEEIKDDLKFQSTSSVRTKILISLSEGPKKTGELKELTGMRSSTILHGISELEKQDMVLRESDTFFLSEIGKIMALKSADMIKTSVSLKKFQRLWLNHEIDFIPQDLLRDIGDLSNSQLVESDNTDVFKTHGTHIEMMLSSKEVKGVSPIFYPDYIDTIAKTIKNGAEVELVLTEEVLKKTIDSHDLNGLEEFKKLTSENRIKVWKLKGNTKVAFTITDKFIVLGLFSIEGMYDSSRLLVSNHEDAIKWCKRLFEHYRQQAEIFKL